MRFFLHMHRARAAWPHWFIFADDDYYVRMHYLSRFEPAPALIPCRRVAQNDALLPMPSRAHTVPNAPRLAPPRRALSRPLSSPYLGPYIILTASPRPAVRFLPRLSSPLASALYHLGLMPTKEYALVPAQHFNMVRALFSPYLGPCLGPI